jgi:CheY-like chemotaxis protein
MRIHYVEDDKADVLALRHLLRNRRDLTIDTSERMDQIGMAPDLASLDALLIDVRRPDSLSIEDDVRAARSFTGAPLIFLTGLDPSPLEARARLAGADGVLSKTSLDADLLTQCLERAKASRGGSQPAEVDADADADAIPLESDAQWPMERPTLASVDTVLSVIERSLADAAYALDDPLRVSASLGDPLRLAHMLRTIRSRPFSAIAVCEASGPLKDLQRTLADRAAQSNITMAFEGDPDVRWYALGSRSDALAGLEALVRACLCACGPRDWIHIGLRLVEGQARIDILSNQGRIADLAQVFSEGAAQASVDRAFMECAVHLLGLRPEQLRMSLHPTPTLTVYL